MGSNQAFHKCFAVSPLRDVFWDVFRAKGFEGVLMKFLYPEDVLSQFRVVYKYGRKGKAVIDAINCWAYKTRKLLGRVKRALLSNSIKVV